jgi:hypothetical protein
MKRPRIREEQMSMRQQAVLGAAMLVGGLVIVGVSVSQMSTAGVVQAQVDRQLTQQTPSGRDSPPAESQPGGTRPTTPAPEPARPQNNQDGEGATTGTSPNLPPKSSDRPPTLGTPLPPAPAEKTGEPLQRK